jgi:tripartite-type tricarboxylate transporter receptor subunit TctC
MLRSAVSRFRRSYPIAARARTNVGTRGTLATIDSSVALDLTFLRRTRRKCGRNVKSATLAAVALIIALAAAPVQAQTVEEFYKGKRITVTVGYGPGGGYDVFARLLARHIGRYIPGNPSLVVQNMPGAGSLTAANYLYSVAPGDGSAFGLFARDMPLLGLLGHNANVQFDPRKFTWLGSSSNFSDDAYVMIVRDDAPVKSIAEMRSPGGPVLVLGGTADGATGGDVPRILQEALGLNNLKLVLGYRDSAAVFLAMERNEVSGRTTDLSAIQSVRPDWLKPGGGYRLLVQYGRLTRHPNYPDVPTARELASTDSGRALIEFTETPLLTMARPYAAPPGVPVERAKALQAAFLAAHRDQQFLDEAAKLGIYISPVSAEEMAASIERMAQSPKALFEQVTKLLGKGG